MKKEKIKKLYIKILFFWIRPDNVLFLCNLLIYLLILNTNQPQLELVLTNQKEK